MQPKMQYVDEFIPDELTLHVYYPKDNTVSELYEDDGETKDYLRGVSTFKTFTNTKISSGVRITQVIKGTYNAGYLEYRLILHGFPKSLKQIVVDDKPIELSKDTLGLPYVQLPKDFNTLEIC